MKKILSSISLFFLLPSYSYGAQLDTLVSETAEELLLFYDWEELLVEAPTRRPTSLKDVAENISIITAEEIRAMNVHSVNEILQTVTGVQVFFRGGHFGGKGSLAIHGSTYEHVLLLLDGVRLNDVDAGYPETTGIPVQIIDRIEIVKGPASSAWGSALGGVINIVTKKPGENQRPAGTLYGSYGEGPSQEYRIDAAGRRGRIGYYLYGGYMDSDGLLDDRYFQNKSLYAKVRGELAEDVALTFTAGYWYPDLKDFDWPASDLNYKNDMENYLVTSKLEAGLAPEMRLALDLYYRGQRWRNHYESLSTGAMMQDQIWDNALYGGSAHLTRESDNHTMLFGAELSRGENDRTWLYASSPSVYWGTEKRNDWAVYFNDTIKWKKLTITPGLRYDHLSIVDAKSDDIVSPSLGATYKITDNTLLRATAGHGFIRPAIGLIVGANGYPGYPVLKPENLWSVQAGIESTGFKNTHLKADIFYHHTDDSWYWDDNLGLYVNGGVSERTGFELNALVSPFAHFTAGLGYTFVWVEPYPEDGDETYGLNIKLNYNTERIGSLTIFGRYFRMVEYETSSGARIDDMIWDLHYNKDIYTHKESGINVNFFFSGRNLFNGKHYGSDFFKNTDRWFEAGLRITY
jgi:vitamin B12 transporter